MRVTHKVTDRHLHHKRQWWAAMTTHQVHQLPTVGDLKLISYLHTCSSTLVTSLGSRQMIEVFAHRSSQTQASATQTRWQKGSIRWIKIIVTQNLAIQDKFFSAIYHLKSSLLSLQKLQKMFLVPTLTASHSPGDNQDAKKNRYRSNNKAPIKKSPVF
jgi:hypothetical protein